MRVDQLLVEKGLVKSRTQSQNLIREGKVHIRSGDIWTCIKKVSLIVDTRCELRIEDGDGQRFVSRAGLKLEAALSYLNYSVAGLTALDIGQSTGGFTDCLLHRGASKVVGVDVGQKQLSPDLAANPSVVCLEGINARRLQPALFSEMNLPVRYDLIVMDVSFISQTLIIPCLAAVLKENGKLISLVKPQFEVGPEGVGKGGLVRDEEHFLRVRDKLFECACLYKYSINDYFESAITGGDGNREFFLYLSKT